MGRGQGASCLLNSPVICPCCCANIETLLCEHGDGNGGRCAGLRALSSRLSPPSTSCIASCITNCNDLSADLAD